MAKLASAKSQTVALLVQTCVKATRHNVFKKKLNMEMRRQKVVGKRIWEGVTHSGETDGGGFSSLASRTAGNEDYPGSHTYWRGIYHLLRALGEKRKQKEKKEI